LRKRELGSAPGRVEFHGLDEGRGRVISRREGLLAKRDQNVIYETKIGIIGREPGHTGKGLEFRFGSHDVAGFVLDEDSKDEVIRDSDDQGSAPLIRSFEDRDVSQIVQQPGQIGARSLKDHRAAQGPFHIGEGLDVDSPPCRAVLEQADLRATWIIHENAEPRSPRGDAKDAAVCPISRGYEHAFLTV